MAPVNIAWADAELANARKTAAAVSAHFLMGKIPSAAILARVGPQSPVSNRRSSCRNLKLLRSRVYFPLNI
jgi:hypothetical protein